MSVRPASQKSLKVYRKSYQTNYFFILAKSFFLVGFLSHLVSVPAVADDLMGETAEASSMNPDELTVGSQNMDAHMASSVNPNSLVVNSQPLPSPVEAHSPASQSSTGESPDALTVQSTRLSSLPQASEVNEEVHQQVWQQVKAAQPEMVQPQTLAGARAVLAKAQSQLDQINAAVGKMIRRDYPTGEPRVRLYDEQKAAQLQVGQAKQWVENLGGSLEEGTSGDGF